MLRVICWPMDRKVGLVLAPGRRDTIDSRSRAGRLPLKIKFTFARSDPRFSLLGNIDRSAVSVSDSVVELQDVEALVLVAHEPAADPRIDWVATSLAKKQRTLVLGIDDSPRQSYSQKPYRVVKSGRRKLSRQSLLAFFGYLFHPARKSFYAFFHPLFFAAALRLAVRWSFNRLRRLFYQTRNEVSARPAGFDPGRHLVLLLRHFLTTEGTLNRPEDRFPFLQTIYANDLDTLFAAVRIQKRNGRAKIIYDNHELYAYQWEDAPEWHQNILAYIEHCFLRFVGDILIVSPQLADEFKSAHHWSEEVFTVPNYSPLVGHFDASEGSVDRGLTFLFQGRFAHGRGLGQLIQLWAQEREVLQNCRLILRGHDNVYKRECIELAKNLGVFNVNVFFPEPVSEEELIQTAREADIGIIPYEPVNINNKYCCPNKLSQYMQAGLAILTNDLPFVAFHVNKFDCGLQYDGAKPATFAESIRKLVGDRDAVARMKRNSRAAAVEACNWSRCEEIILSLA